MVLAIFLPEGVLGRLRRLRAMTALLQVDGLGVRFAGLQALADVSLQAQPGEVIGLIGPNGAGKTTFINAVSGAVPYRGRVSFGGQALGGLKPFQIARLRLARTYQIVQPFPAMTRAGQRRRRRAVRPRRTVPAPRPRLGGGGAGPGRPGVPRRAGRPHS